MLLDTFVAFMAFCLCASGIYIFNDVQDKEDDKQHEQKKYRPLASGAISVAQALPLCVLLIGSGLGLLLALAPAACAVLLFYVLVNFAYSLKLKHIAIVDVNIIALGFVLRLLVGALVCNIELSHWIIIMTFLLALFLALAKRRDDVLIRDRTGQKMRKVVDGYNLQFLDMAMTIMSAVVIVAYLIYTTSSQLAGLNQQYLYLSSFFVVIGILRYLQITLVEENSSSPTQVVLKDRFIQLTLSGWLAFFGWMLYFPL